MQSSSPTGFLGIVSILDLQPSVFSFRQALFYTALCSRSQFSSKMGSASVLRTKDFSIDHSTDDESQVRIYATVGPGARNSTKKAF